MTLEEENIILKKKLLEAQKWMRYEVEKNKSDIAHIEDFLGENISFDEWDAREKIQAYFPPEVFLYLSEEEISCLISSELTYTSILQSEHIDGMNVVLWYHKVLDSFVEKYITLGFRKYVWDRNPPDSHDPLESFFEQVHEKNYSLSFGRLYQILERILEKRELSGYQKLFFEYIQKHPSLKKSLLESDFFVQSQQLVDGEYIGEKRHSGFLEREETTFARNLYIGKLLDQSSLLWTLAGAQALDI